MPVILIIEDDDQVRVLAESVLQGSGYTTLSASSPEQALAILRTDQKVDLLFIDLALQGNFEAGLHAAQEAAKIHPGLAALYTTGQGITDGMKALFVDPYGFLAKPYTAAELCLAVDNLLAPRS